MLAIANGATAQVDPQCAPVGSSDVRYASGLFSRGGGENAALVGNVFAVYAQPLAICGEAGGAPCTSPTPTRTWEITLMTAAHVIKDMCANSSDAWAVGASVFRPGTLSLFSNNKINLPSRADVAVTATWCGRDDIVAAKAKVVTLQERQALFERNKKIVVEGELDKDEERPTRSDIFMFKERFELPTTAVVQPFTVQFLPSGEESLEVKTVRFTRIGRPEDTLAQFSDNRSFFFGKETGTYTTTKPYQSYGYEVGLRVLHATSGAPVGFGVGDKFVVIGIVTDTGELSCAQANARAQAQQAKEQGAPVASPVATDTNDDDGPPVGAAADDQAGKGCDYGDAKAYYDIGSRTGFFMPILRYPDMYEFARDHGPNVRVDVAMRLYAAVLNAPVGSKTAQAYKLELRRVMRELSPLEQALVLLRSKKGSFDLSSDLTCRRLEPRDMDFWQ